MECDNCSVLSDVVCLKMQGELQEADSLISTLITKFDKEHGKTNTCNLCALEKLYNERGQIRYLMVDFNEAINDYTSALELNTRVAVTFYNRGQIHYRMGRYMEAIRDFENALSINNDFNDALEALNTAKVDMERKRGDTGT